MDAANRTPSESLAQSEVEVIEYLLHEQSPESHQTEVEEERWFIELGERAAFKLAYCELGSASHFLINDIWPYLYATNPVFHDVVEDGWTVLPIEDDPVAKRRLGLVP